MPRCADFKGNVFNRFRRGAEDGADQPGGGQYECKREDGVHAVILVERAAYQSAAEQAYRLQGVVHAHGRAFQIGGGDFGNHGRLAGFQDVETDKVHNQAGGNQPQGVQ